MRGDLLADDVISEVLAAYDERYERALRDIGPIWDTKPMDDLFAELRSLVEAAA